MQKKSSSKSQKQYVRYAERKELYRLARQTLARCLPNINDTATIEILGYDLAKNANPILLMRVNKQNRARGALSPYLQDRRKSCEYKMRTTPNTVIGAKMIIDDVMPPLKKNGCIKNVGTNRAALYKRVGPWPCSGNYETE